MEEKKPLHWERLEDDFKKGRSVVLFLGTGVDFGAPRNKDYSWDALLNHLLRYAVNQITYPGEEFVAEMLQTTADKKIKEAVFDKNNISDKSFGEAFEKLKEQISTDTVFPRDVKSTIVKQTLGNEVYVKLIQDFLYGGMDKKIFIEAKEKYVASLDNDADKNTQIGFFTLFSLADLILRNRNIRAIVTQNYDQFLYDALVELKEDTNYRNYVKTKRKAKVRDINPSIICDWKGQTTFTYDDLNIYHVHGYIPRYEEIQAPKDNKIVLSLDEFYEDSRNVYSWQIASQLHFLSQYTCVFCGLSLQDYTNQRLLHYVKGKHHGGNLYYFAAGNAESQIKDRVKNNYHEENGLTVLYDENGFNHLYKLLKKLQYEYD